MRVHLDYHVQVECHFYSVPHRLVRQEVEVRRTATVIEVFHHSERVASHRRSAQHYAYTTLSVPMPVGHRAHAERDADRLLRRAREVGAATEELCRQVLASRAHPEQGYRACLGILRLVEAHGPQRLERASRRAVRTGALSYRSLEAILRHRLEDAPLPEEPLATTPRTQASVREAGYYQDQKEPKPC